MYLYEYLSKIGTKIIRFFFIVFTIIFAICNIIFSAETVLLEYNIVKFEFGLTIIRLAFLITLVLLLYFLIKKQYFGISDKLLLCIFLFVALLISVYWLLSNNFELTNIDDSYNVFYSALSVAKKDYSVLGFHTYINTYPNNLGLLTYEVICIRIFGETGAIFFIRSINILFTLLGYYYLYKLTNVLFHNHIINCTVVFLMFFSGQFIFYAFLLYGNCMSYSMAIISVYYLVNYIKNNNKVDLFLSSIFIIISITIKMNSIIILIAEFIYLLLNFIKTKKVIIIIIILINFLGMYCGTTGIQKYWSIKGKCDYNASKLPLICWVAYGVNYDEKNPGHYFPEFEYYHNMNGCDPNRTSLEAKRYINDVKDAFIKKPYLGLKFYFEKFICSWANPQFEAFDQYRELELTSVNNDIVSGNINNVIDCVWDSTLSIVAIGLFGFLFINKKERTILDYIGCVIVIGGFLFHIEWEVKAIYLYQYYMYLLPYAAYGLVYLTKNREKSSVR